MEISVKAAADALIAAHPIANRGDAFMVLKNVHLHEGGAKVYSAALKIYEETFDVKLKKIDYKAKQDARNAETNKARTMTADDVRHHIAKINAGDGLFWACWRAFKENRYAGLDVKDFAVHFKQRTDE